MRHNEPTQLQVNAIMKAIDEDGSNNISRMEWVQYISVSDGKTGVLTFNAQMRQLFDEWDADHSGSITSYGKTFLYPIFFYDFYDSYLE